MSSATLAWIAIGIALLYGLWTQLEAIGGCIERRRLNRERRGR